jgi:uncharacterized membrane protein YgcG
MKRTFLPAVLLGSLGFALACGGGDELPDVIELPTELPAVEAPADPPPPPPAEEEEAEAEAEEEDEAAGEEAEADADGDKADEPKKPNGPNWNKPGAGTIGGSGGPAKRGGNSGGNTGAKGTSTGGSSGSGGAAKR